MGVCLDTRLGLNTAYETDRYQFDDRGYSMAVIYSRSDKDYKKTGQAGTGLAGYHVYLNTHICNTVHRFL